MVWLKTPIPPTPSCHDCMLHRIPASLHRTRASTLYSFYRGRRCRNGPFHVFREHTNAICRSLIPRLGQFRSTMHTVVSLMWGIGWDLQ